MMENYSALRNKEILSHAITWINPKDIMLSSQSDETIARGWRGRVKWGIVQWE